MKYLKNPAIRTVANLAAVAAVFAAGALGGDITLGLSCAAILLVAFALLEVARWRGVGSVEIVTGIGDERARGIYRSAGFRTSEMFSWFLALYGLIALSGGDDDRTFVTILFTWGGLWIVNIAWAGWASRRPVGAAQA